MKRSALIIGATVALATLAFGCRTKPSEEACEQAIKNIRKLRGLAESDVGANPKAAVRSCRAQSSKETVECFRTADTIEALTKCEGDFGKELFEEEQKRANEQREKQKEKLDKAPSGE